MLLAALFAACSPEWANGSNSKVELDVAVAKEDIGPMTQDSDAVLAPDSAETKAVDATVDVVLIGVCKDLKCQDGNPCTLDKCDPVLGCQFLPAPPTQHCGYMDVGVCNAGTCAATGCSSMAGLQMGAAWPMEGACPNHGGRSPYLGPQTNALKWTFLDPDLKSTGLEPWPGPIVGNNGTVYFAQNAWVVAVDSNGILKWKSKVGPTSAWPTTGALSRNGTLHVGISDSLFAIESTGAVKWTVGTSDFLASPPVLGADETVYFSTHGGILHAVSPNGAVKWKLKTGPYVRSAPSIGDDGTIYVTSKDSYLYAVAPGGQVLWKYKSFGEIWAPAIIASTEEGRIFMVGSGSSIQNEPGQVYALGRDPWEFIPTIEPKIGFWNSLARGADGTVYLSNGCVQAIDSDGKLKWTFDDDSAGVGCAPPAIGGDGTVYVAQGWSRCYPSPNKGPKLCYNDLYALNPDGTLKWKWHTPDAIGTYGLGPPVIAADGTLYVKSTDGHLYAFGK